MRRLAVPLLGAALCLGGLGTAVPALADPPVCPTAPADYTGSDAVVDQLVRARQEAAASCAVTADKLHALGNGLDQEHEDLAAIEAALTLDGGLPVLASPADGATFTTHVDNPPDLTPLVTASATNRDVLREDLWGALGMLVGFGLLMVLWRVLRP